MKTWCILSSRDLIVSTGTPYLELLQPLDGCNVSASNGCSGGHEEEAGQQRQDEDERLGIHREGVTTSSGGLESEEEDNLRDISSPSTP